MTREIRSVLIANRGEIALRVIRACRELGIESVLAHSEADADSLPARLAGRKVCIGGASASASYLDKERIVGAAVAYKVDAIHPGYGFLAENAGFADLCREQDVIFIGPSGDIIRQMGDKIEARRIAQAADVPTIPGSEGKVADPEEARAIAQATGFPLLVKAAAGGGGRGMRVIETEAQLEKGLREAMSEAGAAFGDPSVYIEKYLTDIRHLEVQVLSFDGRTVHLGERDCSSQRRNQKLIEEAPCASIDEETRTALGKAAIDLCQRVGYTNAGTIEFVYDNVGRKFYFIEMNTRVQVEHPVTEMVTGIDIVKEQIRIAGGRPSGLKQQDIVLCGHAIECRINAEDPENDFMPSPGLVSEYRAAGGPGVRIDSHLENGYTIPPFYDSLIAKIITWGADRDEAIDRMLRALDETRIQGVTTTARLHMSILNTERFRSGNVNTAMIREMLEERRNRPLAEVAE